MAKKKTETTANNQTTAEGTESAPKKKAAAPKAAGATKAPAKKGAKKKPETTAAAGGSPMVDTGLAAQNVARMLATRAKLGINPEAASAESKESGSFKQLKESLGKSAGNPLGAVNTALGPQKSNLPLNQYNQIFHNQTQGGTNRTNVPRRTGG